MTIECIIIKAEQMERNTPLESINLGSSLLNFMMMFNIAPSEVKLSSNEGVGGRRWRIFVVYLDKFAEKDLQILTTTTLQPHQQTFRIYATKEVCCIS